MKALNIAILIVSSSMAFATNAAVYNMQELSGANASTAGAGFKKMRLQLSLHLLQ